MAEWSLAQATEVVKPEEGDPIVSGGGRTRNQGECEAVAARPILRTSTCLNMHLLEH